ncbi:TOBE domain-containing protein, partial [Klebsiella pneumoniae]|uniref:TOBE domain-containing protein n=1 Tax=Klebsiella pneumoniae TaxID=573 RepID=UPI003531828B
LTVVFVTHDQEEAMNLSDRIIIMDKGEIVGDGSPQALYRQPDSRFVAGFLGECNFIPDDRIGSLGVRPEHMLVGRACEGAARCYQGNIVMSTFCGLHLKLLIEHQGQMLVAYAPVDLPEQDRMAGQSVSFGFQPEQAM